MKMPKLKPDTPLERLWNGIVKENPTFVLMLGMCPTLAVTTGAINGLGMGLSTAAVLILSNMMISFLRHVIPDGVRMPAYIVIVASFVTVVELLMHAFVTDLYEALGIYRLSWSTVSFWGVPKHTPPSTACWHPLLTGWAWDWASPSH